MMGNDFLRKLHRQLGSLSSAYFGMLFCGLYPGRVVPGPKSLRSAESVSVIANFRPTLDRGTRWLALTWTEKSPSTTGRFFRSSSGSETAPILPPAHHRHTDYRKTSGFARHFANFGCR